MLRVSGVVLLVGLVGLFGATARSQEGRLALFLQEVDVTTSRGRLVLSTANGQSYELAALEAPDECPAPGGGTWACGDGARQVLAGAVAGEQLECTILENGTLPAVECRAQTRNLNVWMLDIGRAKLHADWKGRFTHYDDAASAANAAGALVWNTGAVESSRSDVTERLPAAGSETYELGQPLPARNGLRTRAERRGATAAERSVIAAELPEDKLRAGVWVFNTYRVVVAEDAFGCVRFTWCRFAVLDGEGDVVVSGTAREAPELLLWNGAAAAAGDADGPDLAGLVWEEPAGTWREWRP